MMANRPQIMLMLVTLTFLHLLCQGHAARIVSSFVAPERSGETGQLYCMALEPRSGDLLVGSINNIYRLSLSLVKRPEISVGPYLDNPSCPPPNVGNCTCGRSVPSQLCDQQMRVPTDNHIRSLVVDPSTREVTAFGSVYHGSSQRISLDNTSNREATLHGGLFTNTSLGVITVLALGPGRSAAMYIAAPRAILPTAPSDASWVNPPLIATRSLPNYEIARNSTRGKTAIFLKPSLRNTIHLEYKYAFSHEGFTYFLAVQKQSGFSLVYESRIMRVCQDDQSYNSYAEMLLSCQGPPTSTSSGNKVNYNIVTAATTGPMGKTLADNLLVSRDDTFLYAAFSRSYDNSIDVTKNAAVCVFRMRDVIAQFAEMTENCFQGGRLGQIGPAHISDVGQCTRFQTPVTIGPNYCGVYDINTPLESVKTNVSSIVTLPITGYVISTISSTLVHDETVVYLGTKTGRMLQMVLQDATSSVDLPELVLERDPPIYQSIVHPNENASLVIMTQNKVLKVDVGDCSSHTDCESCMALRNPHCGWCLWDESCGEKSQCQTESGWLSSFSAKCLSIRAIRPSQLELLQANKTVSTLDIEHLPSGDDIEHKMTCELRKGNYVSEVSSTPMGDTLVCSRFQYPTSISSETGSTSMEISFKFQGEVIATNNFTVYDCTQITSCSACTSGTLPCAWCPESHRCAYSSNVASPSMCINEPYIYATSVNALQRNSHSRQAGAALCPRISLPQVVVNASSGSRKQVRVYGYNIEDYHKPVQCRFTQLGNSPVSVEATVYTSNDVAKIQCALYTFRYLEDTPFQYVKLDIVSRSENIIDNPDNVRVKMYKCHLMVSDCGRCLTMERTYQCGWCGDQCSVQSDCVNSNVWTGREGVCPNPQIFRFTPLSGPVSGGTKLTVHGMNLGKTVDDIRDAVYINRVPCQVLDEGYVPSITFMCETGSPFDHRAMNGSISVRVSNMYNTSSPTRYIYQNSEANRFFPNKGPLSGGTLVAVYGNNLDSGSTIQVLVHNREGTLVRRNRTVLEFKTPKQTFPVQGRISILIDRSQLNMQEMFLYSKDPAVTEIKGTAAVVSGGSVMSFIGSDLDIVQQPKLKISFTTRPSRARRSASPLEKSFEMDCHANRSTLLTCPTPDLRDEPLGGASVSANYGLKMDGVTALETLSDNFPPLVIHPDPLIEPLTKELKYQDGIEVRIEGQGLDVCRDVPGLLVTVDGKPCNVSVIRENYITCTPPKQVSSAHAGIVVILGNYRKEVGILAYSSAAASKMPLILGVVLGVLLPIILIILLLVLCLRRQNQLKKMRKRRHNPFTGGMPMTERPLAPRTQNNRYTSPEQVPLRNNSQSNAEVEDVPLPIVKNGKDAANAHPHLKYLDRERLSDPMAKTVSTSSHPDEEAALLNSAPNTPPPPPEGATANPFSGQDLTQPQSRKSAELNKNVSARKPKDSELDSLVDPDDEESAVPPGYLENLLNNIEEDALRSAIQEVLVNRDRIALGHVLGKGHFGRVYYGTMTEDDETMDVAVKTLQGRYLEQAAVESFLKEGVMMKNFDHPHVLRLLGVSINGADFPMVILPYMCNGDLRSYVKNKNKSFTARQLLHLAQQVAEGMTYLASLNFVHRDLAARNCMVSEQNIVKVADFGLSKDLYDKDYYASKDRKRKMPIKWMALECLEDYIFTTKSDVWAFGVLMWELLTRGVTPYPDVDVFEVRNYLASGRRLRQPKYCPDNIYRIMTTCWQKDASERPTFVDLVNRLELIINPPRKKPVPQAGEEEDDEPLYMNIQALQATAAAYQAGSSSGSRPGSTSDSRPESTSGVNDSKDDTAAYAPKPKPKPKPKDAPLPPKPPALPPKPTTPETATAADGYLSALTLEQNATSTC